MMDDGSSGLWFVGGPKRNDVRNVIPGRYE